MFELGPRESDPVDEAEVRLLLTEAGEPPVLPAQDLAEIASAARAAWQQGLAVPLGGSRLRDRPSILEPARRPVAARTAWGLAAAAVAAVGFAGWWMAAGRSSLPVQARVERVHGVVQFESPDNGREGSRTPAALTVGEAVEVGSTLTTEGTADGPGGMALRLAGGASLRLDDDTRIRLISAGRIELDRGAVYVDHADGAAGEGRQRSQVEIVTPYGNVMEIGTQFSVRRSAVGSQLEVRVREGEVQVVRPGATASASAGIELLVGQDGSIRRREIEAHGPEWDWVLDRAPGFDIEGRTLGEFLDWVGRETGWRIELSTAAADRAVGEIVLHGSTAGLRPDRAVFVVLSGADLAGERVDGMLRVRLRQGDGG